MDFEKVNADNKAYNYGQRISAVEDRVEELSDLLRTQTGLLNGLLLNFERDKAVNEERQRQIFDKLDENNKNFATISKDLRDFTDSQKNERIGRSEKILIGFLMAIIGVFVTYIATGIGLK